MRAWIYDRALLPLTGGWYREVLSRLPEGARLLDIGIGTGGALCKNAALVRERDLRVCGIDIDEAYVKRATAAVAEADLAGRVEVRRVSVYDFNENGFDAAYFSASFMILPDPVAALKHVLTLVKPDGRVYFTQTFEERPSALVEKAKPLLKKITTIEFGKVTYEADFLDTVAKSGLQVVEHTKLNEGKRRTGRLIVGKAA